jgi:hypothetical protein
MILYHYILIKLQFQAYPRPSAKARRQTNYSADRGNALERHPRRKGSRPFRQVWTDS